MPLKRFKDCVLRYYGETNLHVDTETARNKVIINYLAQMKVSTQPIQLS